MGLVRDNDLGMTLIETLVALGILAAVGVTFLVGMTVSSEAIMVSQERVTAESLAKSQMEYINSQPYDEDNNPPQYDKLGGMPDSHGYDMEISAIRLDPLENGSDNDDGLQQITITVNRGGETLLSLVD